MKLSSRCPSHGLQLSRIKLGGRPGLLAPAGKAIMWEPLCISIRHTIPGELLCELAGSEVGELRLWELRLQFCQDQETLPFFGWIFFHEERVLDAALVSEYRKDPLSASIQFSVVVRKLRPPTQGEVLAIEESIQLRHKSHLWAILTKGISMPSLVRRGTSWVSILVKVITVDYPFTYDVGPLPNCLTALLIAKCDPNVLGNSSLSPIGVAIRRGEGHTVETLLQFRADPHLKEDRNERPLIMAIARRATKCVQVLLEYRADPRTTMSVPLTGPYGARARGKRRATAMDLATAYPASPEIVALLTNALELTAANRKQR